MTKQIKVLYFASIREAFGTGAESLQTSAATVGAPGKNRNMETCGTRQ